MPFLGPTGTGEDHMAGLGPYPGVFPRYQVGVAAITGKPLQSMWAVESVVLHETVSQTNVATGVLHSACFRGRVSEIDQSLYPLCRDRHSERFGGGYKRVPCRDNRSGGYLLAPRFA